MKSIPILQGPASHTIDSSGNPEQLWPRHLRVLLLVPEAHVTEHDDQTDHLLHPEHINIHIIYFIKV